MKVKEILKNKGPEVYTIWEEKTLADAVKILVGNNIGAVLVLNAKGKIAGIISERDIVRFCDKSLDKLTTTRIKEVMTEELIIVEPEDDLAYVRATMTENRIRHLPVVENRILVGIISIGDVVKAHIDDTETENKYLRDYISGNVPKM